MKKYLFVSALILSGLFACNSGDLSLIKNNSSEYDIVVPLDADSLELRSSEELQKYLQLISGIGMDIRVEDKSSSNKKIFIGNTTEGKLFNVMDDEIIIRVKDENLFILGGDPESTLYAVYTFLENYLGCRFYAPDVEVLPETDHVSVRHDIDHRYTPQVTTRTVHSGCTMRTRLSLIKGR